MEGQGYVLNTDDGRVELSLRRRGKQFLGLVVGIAAGLGCAAAGVAAGQPLLAAVALLAGAGTALWFYRSLLISGNSSLEVAEGVIRWSAVEGLTSAEHSRPIRDVVPDSEGHIFKVLTIIHSAPGSRQLSGIPASVSVHLSRGPGVGWSRLISVETLKPHAEALRDALLENLPRARPAD